jgi:hypothetical protein
MNTQIQRYRTDIGVISDTALQISKDFGLGENEIKISGDPQKAYAELEMQLLPIIKKMYSGNSEDLMNLLYRIDVSENDIRKALSLNDAKGIVTSVTGLIIEREFIKCVTRRVYSSDQN